MDPMGCTTTPNFGPTLPTVKNPGVFFVPADRAATGGLWSKSLSGLVECFLHGFLGIQRVASR